jgi:hypothetical protein
MDIIDLLRREGPCLSSELATTLVDRFGLTPVAARKRISRQSMPVKRLAYLPFARNARFLYLQEQYGGDWFWERLETALLQHSPTYGGAISAVRQRGGIIPKPHFLIACGSPLKQQRHLSPQTVLDRLVKAQLLEEIEVPGIGPCVARAQEKAYYNELIPAMQARLVVEDIMLKAVRGWARNLGIVSYGKVKIRGEGPALPQVGTFAWDFSAPSYLGGLADWSEDQKPRPGFFVCDIVFGEEVTAAGIAPFIHKCKTLRSLTNVGRCVQLFIAEKYTNDAFAAAKSAGIMPGTPANLFGEQIAASLHQLAQVLLQAASVTDVKVFDELFSALSRIEGAAVNLRGALFEFWAAEVVRQLYGGAHIRMNRVFADGSARAEVDVQALLAAREVRFYECKGYQPGGLVPDEEVERWLKHRVPLVYGQMNLDRQGRQFHFEFWTTGRLSESAVAMLDEAKAKLRPSRYTIDYRDANSLLEVARQTKDQAIIGALRQHFLDHPMAKSSRRRQAEPDDEEEDRPRRQLVNMRGVRSS